MALTVDAGVGFGESEKSSAVVDIAGLRFGLVRFGLGVVLVVLVMIVVLVVLTARQLVRSASDQSDGQQEEQVTQHCLQAKS